MHEFIERLHRALECYRALQERSTVVRAYPSAYQARLQVARRATLLEVARL